MEYQGFANFFFFQTLSKLLRTKKLTDIEFGSKQENPETINLF